MDRRDFIRSSAVWLLAAATAPHVLARSRGPGEPSPSLFFPEEHIAALRIRIAAEGSLRARWETLLAQAERYLAMPAVESLLTGRPFTSAEKYPLAGRDLRPMAFTLGLAWRVTGNERYARPLREALLQCAGYADWSMPSTGGRTPPWHGDLWTAVFTVSCAAGREALGDYLTAGEREKIGRSIRQLGVEPLLADWVLPAGRIHALDSMGHNWWCVCIAGAGVGALAVMDEEPRARGWVREVDAALEAFFDYRGQVLHNKPANFDSAGAFYEGVHYADYTLAEYLTYRLARTQRIPTEAPAAIPVLDRAAEFFVHASYPATEGWRALDFGDSRATDDAQRSMRLLRLQGHSPALAAWYLQHIDPESGDPLTLLHEESFGVAPRNDLPTSVLYPRIGWAMLRSSWANDATLLAVRCGDTWNHAHADAGSFILWHAGRPLLIDSGTCSYGRREYTDYYRQSRAHNVVLFNGQGEPTEHVHERGAKFRGRLHELIDGAGLKYLYADATGPMARHFSRNYRHWLWLDGVILIFDEILAHEPGRFDWLLHYAGEARRDDAAVEIVNGPASARVTMLHPANPRVREEPGLAPDEPDVPRTFLAWSPREESREQKFIVAIVPGGSAVEPQLEMIEQPGVLGVRVRTRDEITEVYLNLAADGRRMHLNSTLVLEGWETDAYLFAFTRPVGETASSLANTTRYFVAAGSYLRRGGQTVLSSVSKITAAFRPAAELDVHLHGQPMLDVALYCAAPPQSVRANGEAVTFDYSAQERTARFRTSLHVSHDED